MVTLEEFYKVANIIDKNQKDFLEEIVYDYENWYSCDGLHFTKVDEDNNTFEVNSHRQLHYLGKASPGFAIFKGKRRTNVT